MLAFDGLMAFGGYRVHDCTDILLSFGSVYDFRPWVHGLGFRV